MNITNEPKKPVNPYHILITVLVLIILAGFIFYFFFDKPHQKEPKLSTLIIPLAMPEKVDSITSVAVARVGKADFQGWDYQDNEVKGTIFWLLPLDSTGKVINPKTAIPIINYSVVPADSERVVLENLINKR